jgi:hypothetical protein
MDGWLMLQTWCGDVCTRSSARGLVLLRLVADVDDDKLGWQNVSPVHLG